MMLALLLLAAQNDKAQANARDDAWESAWVTHCRGIYTTTNKTSGMVLQVGDSITYSNPYGQWPRYGAGKTAEDAALLAWCKATQAFPGSLTATDKNGFYLCAADVSNRSMTAASGISTAESLSGAGNGATPMPSTTSTATAQGYVTSASYGANLQITTLAAAFADAQVAVVMLGTNDVLGGRSAGAFIADLTSIVDVLEGRNIVVILSTLPPCKSGDVTPHNAAIRTFAETRGLPLIDFYEEILARRPGIAWQDTLISGDGIHPTGAASAADPYTPGGNPATHQTGTNATNDGYLLRSWLTVQKLKEVKSYVVDGVDPPAAPPAPPAPAAPPPVVASSSSGSGDDEGACSCGTVRVAIPPLVGLLGLLLLAGRRR